MLTAIPCWTDPDGTGTGRFYPAVRTQKEVETQVQCGFDEARRARGTDAMVQIVDDVSGHLVARIRRRA